MKRRSKVTRADLHQWPAGSIKQCWGNIILFSDHLSRWLQTSSCALLGANSSTSRRDGVVQRGIASLLLFSYICPPGYCKHNSRPNTEGSQLVNDDVNTVVAADSPRQGSPKKHVECGRSEGLPRVVGQYEGWSIDRDCQPFVPEQIPKGIYTHLNYAYATIDPETFEIRPGYLHDPVMYRRFTRLKRRDPDLKVSIAIG